MTPYTRFYVTYDANGNIMQKLDSTGADQMNVAYDPFGNIISGTLVGEYGFSTKLLVADIDWYYYGFRYYDPVTGRWPSRDPVGERGGINLYVLAYNSPLGRIDVLGLSSDCESLGIVDTVTFRTFISSSGRQDIDIVRTERASQDLGILGTRITVINVWRTEVYNTYKYEVYDYEGFWCQCPSPHSKTERHLVDSWENTELDTGSIDLDSRFSHYEWIKPWQPEPFHR